MVTDCPQAMSKPKQMNAKRLINFSCLSFILVIRKPKNNGVEIELNRVGYNADGNLFDPHLTESANINRI